MTDSSENPFWEYSLALYAREGVAAACLRLQDGLGIDVNLLLFCCWTAQCASFRFDEETLAQFVGSVAPWKVAVVEPLRTARRDLKSGFEGVSPIAGAALREKIKVLELEAEKLQQDALFRLFQASITDRDAKLPPAERREIAYRNSELYLSAYATHFDDAVHNDVAYIIDCAFDAA